MSKNIQILLETIVRCGGNCSGCALGSSERMQKVDFDFFNFSLKAKKINQLLKQYMNEEIESVTLFLGQGDHFLMDDKDIPQFMEICSTIVPQEIKHKTTILITASAIAKKDVIKQKMDQFYEYSLQYKIPFFIQTVFDPKKIVLHDNFKDTYIENILYFKQKCGITELTINLGEDIINQMKPQEFHEWVKQYDFKHVEMNWVLSHLTHNMWKKHSQEMYNWLKEWLLIVKHDYVYEVNFVPIMSRHLKIKDKELLEALKDIEQSLMENVYIDYSGNIILGQMGIISNLTPFNERLSETTNNINTHITGKQIYQSMQKEATTIAKDISKKLLKKSTCLSCEYKTVCAVSGAVAWFKYDDGSNVENCPWQIKQFIDFLDTSMSQASRVTVFDKNPIQSLELKQENNENHEYFEERFIS